MHPMLYFKNVAPFLVFGPPLLLNPGDGPGLHGLFFTSTEKYNCLIRWAQVQIVEVMYH